MNPGCYYFKAILASVGWNKNFEYFTAEELYKALYGAVDEPLNYNHEEYKIIGHIIKSSVGLGDPESEDFEILDSAEWDQVKNGFHLITDAAIYVDYWRSPEQTSEMQQLIEQIKAGQWFVSLEAWPESFDFILSKDGVDKIIEFNEGTAFLAKYLRQYGGTGNFNGYKLGRLLRNFKLVGKGLVRNPANPNSIILSETNMENKAELEVATKELESVKAELASAQKAIEEKNAEVSTLTATVKSLTEDKSTLTAKVAELNVSVEKLTAETAVKVAELETVKASVTTLENSVKEKDVVIAGLNETVSGFKNSGRLEKLVAASGLDKEVAQKTVDALANVSDEVFESVLASYGEKKLGENVEPETEPVLAAATTNDDKQNKLQEQVNSFLNGD